ncbi:MAG: hypothetical protein JO300_03805 [Silvibacterium sp.]|nr:hypothetical protein [Silvibacterium sp.]MBV8437560.1 hypothetical protein [Silvibacterium sp.]MBV8629574.1 hypothetical protein [Silvibacterium sp.]
MLHLDGPLVLLGFILPAALGAGSSAGALALDSRLRHAHHLVSDAVGLMFQWVVYFTDSQLALNEQRC